MRVVRKRPKVQGVIAGMPEKAGRKKADVTYASYIRKKKINKTKLLK